MEHGTTARFYGFRSINHSCRRKEFGGQNEIIKEKWSNHVHPHNAVKPLVWVILGNFLIFSDLYGCLLIFLEHWFAKPPSWNPEKRSHFQALSCRSTRRISLCRNIFGLNRMLPSVLKQYTPARWVNIYYFTFKFSFYT